MLYNEKDSALLEQGQEEPEEQKEQSLLHRLWSSATRRRKNKASAEDEEYPEEEAAEEERENEDTPPEPEAPKVDEKVLKNAIEGENWLEALRQNLPMQIAMGMTGGYYSDFMTDRVLPDTEQRNFLKEMERIAKSILEEKSRLERALANPPEDAAARKELEKEASAPADAAVYVKTSPDWMQAWIFCFPPRNGGKELSADLILNALKKAGIKYGLQEDVIGNTAQNKLFFQLITVALGKAPVDGIDGYVEELFPREYQVEIKEQDDRTVNYKDLNWLHQITAGGVICNIIPPTAAENGIRVTGSEAKARSGRDAIVPKGKNTSVNPEGSALIADIDGEVCFAENKFKVEPMLLINGDVDNSTGNLDFVGDIIVSGDVRTGFTLKASGHITIKGMAEGSWVIAGGNIQVGAGMNGSGRGVLDAQGDVRCKYLENCTVNANGCVYSDSIVNSIVYCNNQVQVNSGYGVIIGGTVTAAKGIQCRVVGNQSSRPTVLVLGSTPNLLKERSDLEDQFHALDNEIDELLKSISYLQNFKGNSPDQQKMQSDLRLKLPIMKLKKSKLEQRLKEIAEASTDLGGCRILCDTLYPPTQINIGSAALMVQNTERNCNIYYSAGEVHIGIR